MRQTIFIATCLALAASAWMLPEAAIAQNSYVIMSTPDLRTPEAVSQQAQANCAPYKGSDYTVCFNNEVQRLAQIGAQQNAADVQQSGTAPQSIDAGTAILLGVGTAAQGRADSDAAAIQTLQQHPVPPIQHTNCRYVAPTPITPGGMNCTTTNY